MIDEIIELSHGAGAGKACPQCGQKARRVDTQTVKAMLATSLHAVGALDYYFCRTEECPVVYFAAGDEQGEQTIGEEALRERVYQKHPANEDILICYCFRHTPRSIREEWQQTGQSSVIETITVGTQTGQCACDIRNPQGTCCLGNVRQLVRLMTQQ